MAPILLSMARETVLWPLSATLAVMAAGFFLRDRILPSALAIGAGFLCGYTLIYGIYAFPPAEAQGWIPLLILLNFAVFSLDDRYVFPVSARLALQGIFSAAGTALIFLPLFKTGISPATLLASTALWFGTWIAIDRQEGPALFLVAIGNAVVSATTGSTMLGQFGGVLATVLGAHLAFNLPGVRIPLGRAGSAVSAAILSSLMLIGHVYAETALFPTLLLLVAFGAPFVAKRLIPERKILQFALCTILALIPVAVASTIAARTYLSQEY